MVEVLFGLARLGQKRWRNPFRCRRLDRMVLLLLLLPSLYACRILLMLLSPLLKLLLLLHHEFLVLFGLPPVRKGHARAKGVRTRRI